MHFSKTAKSEVNMTPVTLTPAQIHVLNMASRIKTEAGLQRLKDQIALFYAKLVDEEMDELWDSGKWNNETLQNLKNAHSRTKYQ